MASQDKQGPRFDPLRLLLVLIPCLLFLPEILGFSQFAGWDITRLNLPLKWFDVQSLRDGVLPLWNHYLYAGMPQLAESESGLFYPGNLLLHLPGDFFYWANLTIIGHLILAGLFCDLWLRGRGMTRAASFAGAILFQTAPFLLFHISSIALLQAVIWFPLLLWLADRVIEETDPRKARLLMGWIALLGGLLMLIGSAQMAFYEGFLLFWYLVGHVLSTREKRSARLQRSIGALIALGLGGLLLGAVIWIPAREFAAGTVRETVGKGFYWLGTWLTPSRLASAFYFPAYGQRTEMVGWMSSLIYVGLFPALLALLRLMGLRVNWRKDAPLIVMGAVALFLAFGMNNPVSHFLITLPPFSLFRYQGRLALGVLLVVLALAAQMLSRQGNEGVYPQTDFGSFSERRSAEPQLRMLCPRLRRGLAEPGLRAPLMWSLGIILIGLVAFILNAHRSQAIMWGGVVLIVDIILTWWAITRALSRPSRRFPAWLAVYLLFHLLLVYPVGRLATMYRSSFNEALSFFNHLERSDALPPRLLVVDVGRFADRDLLSFNLLTPQDHLPNLCAGNTAVFAGVQTLDPYTPLRPTAWHRIVREEIGGAFRDWSAIGVLDDDTANLLRLLGVDAIVTSGGIQAIPSFELSDVDLTGAFGPDARLYKAATQQPRVGVARADTWISRSNGRSGNYVDRLIDKLLMLLMYDPYGTTTSMDVSIAPEDDGFVHAPPASVWGDVAEITLSPASARVNLNAPQDRMWCIVSLSYDPNWEVKLDGEQVEFRRANVSFCAVRIDEPGPHVIEFHYKPRSAIIGSRFSIAGLILLIVWMLANAPRKRPSPLS